MPEKPPVFLLVCVHHRTRPGGELVFHPSVLMGRFAGVTEPDGLFIKGTREEAYERALVAMRSVAIEEIEKVTPPDWLDFIDFYGSLADESDRAVPVLTFAYFENAMGRLLREAVNEDVHGGVDQLFSALGPLSTASAQITMAHALHWINSSTVHDLQLLRRIRNRHAHSRVVDGLDDQSTVDLLGQHHLLPDMLNALSTEFPMEEVFSRRMRMIAASAFTAWTALAQLYVAPTAIRLGMPPGPMFDPSTGAAPEAIVSQHRLMKRFLEVVVWDPLLARLEEVGPIYLSDGKTMIRVLEEE